MSRLDTIFADLRARNRRGLMPFVCAGFPTLEDTAGTLEAVDRAGASVIEVGIPFSDPIADGPVIAGAMTEALSRGVTPAAVFGCVRGARDRIQAGLVAMVSVSLVEHAGPARFVRDAAEAGFDGLIVPDVPLEESGPLRALAGEAGLSLSLLSSPSTPPARASAIARASTGFVYLLARSGITGERQDAPEIEGPVRVLREATDLPIACGFGIATPEHVRAVVRHADAAIVGSALVRAMAAAAARGASASRAAADLVGALASGL